VGRCLRSLERLLVQQCRKFFAEHLSIYHWAKSTDITAMFGFNSALVLGELAQIFPWRLRFEPSLTSPRTIALETICSLAQQAFTSLPASAVSIFIQALFKRTAFGCLWPFKLTRRKKFTEALKGQFANILEFMGSKGPNNPPKWYFSRLFEGGFQKNALAAFYFCCDLRKWGGKKGGGGGGGGGKKPMGGGPLPKRGQFFF